ncbi:Lipopolysaccharide export system permease protein LptG [Pseudomonas chlororaphis subsp. aurantiaca]|uniref:LPS export ABC transporter permease LptG n=1 Tax=Pseudomonas chlororaphis subsp. aurantiaca TaxID=86192 RepID=A0AAJ0ZNL9_9PSED|nr:LPS export ABC transporter permease LptG [Pseudomonas chlororaphis]AZD20394.1 Lipopolysaccharide export system permease protein LptG [Pseudomonas chlororaphis subsp. aurantiaca]AZD33852.1 Lipopolysaccharide export system permease protein LptG [Pseudomonas chlororaphis subsp. aurantiaca]AZD40186.1 Lipopolysaccharide export system permease protein LptG [Pseudomonas chlororaphis subsp. aurantiaca]AZD52958.1 Lipopolysaccharide export system permease protein LptG [Pseudomonas chlororaphis subsp. 
MVKLDRYIGNSVLLAILAVLGIILGLASLFAFIDEMGSVSDSYTVMDVLSFVVLTAPRRLYEMLPMAALIGCLIGLGSLASNSELTIMRAAGVSVGRIVWAVMKPMLFLMVAGVLIGEYVAPATESQAQASRALAQGSGDAQSSKHGLWHRQGEEFIHINAVQPNGLLYGVTRYHFDDQRHMLSSSFARQARFEENYWQLSDVTTTYFREGHTEVINTPQERWDVALSPQLLSTVVMAPESLSISGLWGYIHYLADQGLNNGRYWLAFWVKVLQPLVTAALVLMAISFIFGPLRSVTLGQRVFTGVLVGFTFRIAQDLLGPSSLVFGFSPLFAVLVPAGICALAGLWLLRRAG